MRLPGSDCDITHCHNSCDNGLEQGSTPHPPNSRRLGRTVLRIDEDDEEQVDNQDGSD